MRIRGEGGREGEEVKRQDFCCNVVAHSYLCVFAFVDRQKMIPECVVGCFLARLSLHNRPSR
jgi:hypothetical protein